jgi:hypothetical protein
MSPDFQANLKEMRVRSTEHPPSQQDIDRILAKGASDADVRKFKRFLRRMRMAFFLDSQNRPLSARQRLVNQYKQDGLVLFLGAGVSVEGCTQLAGSCESRFAEVGNCSSGLEPD